MKKLIRAFLFICIFMPISAPLPAQQDSCRIGLYINSLTDFDIANQSFSSDFWLWFNYRNDSLVINDAIEIAHAKEFSSTNFSSEKKGDMNWAQMKNKAVIEKQWDVTNFPFDKQKLTIEIENSYYDADELEFIPDTENSRIDSNLKLKEWNIDSMTFSSMDKIYNTTYGDPELTGSSTYPAVVSEIYLTRAHSWNTFFKMLTGVYIAFAIILLAFFVKPTDRLGLCVGGLFAVVGNKYIIESSVPSTVSNTLLDNIHNLTFVFIFIVLVLAVLSFRWQERGDDKSALNAKKLDMTAFAVVAVLYLTFNFILVMSAAG